MAPENNHTAVLILAAGKASRLGHPKQLLKWKETTLLQHIIDTAKASQPLKVVLILGAYYNQIINSIDTRGITIYHNRSWKKGLGDSLAFGLKNAITEFKEIKSALIMLADQPQINAEHLEQMIVKLQPEKRQIIATQYTDKPIGVPALFDSCYFDELIKLQGDEGAKKIILSNLDRVQTLKLDAPFEDIDTWEDYMRLCI